MGQRKSICSFSISWPLPCWPQHSSSLPLICCSLQGGQLERKLFYHDAHHLALHWSGALPFTVMLSKKLRLETGQKLLLKATLEGFSWLPEPWLLSEPHSLWTSALTSSQERMFPWRPGAVCPSVYHSAHAHETSHRSIISRELVYSWGAVGFSIHPWEGLRVRIYLGVGPHGRGCSRGELKEII